MASASATSSSASFLTVRFSHGIFCIIPHLCGSCATHLGVRDLYDGFFTDDQPSTFYCATYSDRVFSAEQACHLMQFICFPCAVLCGCDKLWFRERRNIVRHTVGLPLFMAVLNNDQSSFVSLADDPEGSLVRVHHRNLVAPTPRKPVKCRLVERFEDDGTDEEESWTVAGNRILQRRKAEEAAAAAAAEEEERAADDAVAALVVNETNSTSHAQDPDGDDVIVECTQ